MQPRARPIAHLCTHIRIMLYPALSRDHLPVNHSSERRELARHGIAWELVSSFLKIAAEFSLHACMLTGYNDTFSSWECWSAEQPEHGVRE